MKKILYICNVNMDGRFLQGVVAKINGQRKAFLANGFEMDLLYLGDNDDLILLEASGVKVSFKGGRVISSGNLFSKVFSHFRVANWGSINFSYCFDTLAGKDYAAVYIRFYLPGSNLIQFLKKFKKKNTSARILLEYPTLNVITELKRRDIVSRVSYLLNKEKIRQLNELTDIIITLTKHQSLFGKPSIWMGNGFDFANIQPVQVPAFQDTIVLLGVASDYSFFHGFDKIIKGLADYKSTNSGISIVFKIISNPRSKYVGELKMLAEKLNVASIIFFEPGKTREELTIEYQQSHIGIGTLALHRINLMDNYSLKHREYSAFGLPFIMSKGDDHFEASPFVLTVERDEEPLNIQQVVNFYLKLRKNHSAYPQEFRNSVEDKITWNVQMKNVFEVINKA